ncbi:MAG: oligosaccharide flippase family protein [Pyrinomonadaceae bacterium]|nr:oligosaccharide flippase family protein [Pyrinomonadaceae bacterium]
MSRSTSLTGQSIWILTAKVIGFGLNVVLPILIVRFLSQTDFGTYKQAFLFVGNAVVILPIGFSMSAYYFLNRRPEKRTQTVLNILAFNFLLGGLACVAIITAPRVVGVIFHNDRLTEHAPLIGLLIWLMIFSGLLEIIPLANQEARIGSILILFTQTTRTLIMVGAVILFGTVEAILYAAILHALIQVLALLVYLLKRFAGFWKSFDRKFFYEQLTYAIPFGLASLVYTSQTDIHNYFVSNNYGPADFALYAVGCFQIPLIWAVYESVSAVVIPKMSEFRANGRIHDMLTLSIQAMQRLALVFFPIFFFLEIVAEDFIVTLFTNQYLSSVPIFRINLILLPFICVIVDPVGRAFPDIGRFLLKLRTIVLIMLVVGLSLLIGRVDLTKIILFVVCAMLIELLATVSRVSKALEARVDDIRLLKDTGKIALSAIMSAIVFLGLYTIARSPALIYCIDSGTWIARSLGFEIAGELIGRVVFLVLCFLLFGLIYLAAAIGMDVIDRETRRRLFSLRSASS